MLHNLIDKTKKCIIALNYVIACEILYGKKNYLFFHFLRLQWAFSKAN